MRHLAALLLAGAVWAPFPAGAAVLGLTLQPVGLCTLSGCADPALEVDYLQRIWAQADIRIDVLAPYSASLPDVATTAEGEAAALDMLQAFAAWQRHQGVAPETAYVGLAGPLTGSTRGMGYVNAAGFASAPFAIAEAAPGRFGTGTAAHELGHILGAHHLDGRWLMSPSLPRRPFLDPAYLPPLDPETVRVARTSPLLVPVEEALPVPLPATAPALVLALAALVLAGLRKRVGFRGRGGRLNAG